MSGKPTVTGNSARIDALEGCIDSDIERLTKAMVALEESIPDKVVEHVRAYLNNGGGKQIAQIVTTELSEWQQREWTRELELRKLQLEEQKEENRKYGAARDAERQAREDEAKETAAKRDRRTKLLIAAVPIITAIVTYLLTRS